MLLWNKFHLQETQVIPKTNTVVFAYFPLMKVGL
jgi:hypothetical protein